MIFKRNRINKKHMGDLKKRSSMGINFYVPVAMLALFTEEFYKRHFEYALIFLISLTSVSVFRHVHNLFFNKLSVNRKTNNYMFFMGVYATSLIWGIGFAYMMTLKNETEPQMIMLACTIGLSSGGVVAFIPNRNLSVFFNLFILGPVFIISFLFYSSPSLTFLIFLFSLYMILIALRGNKEYWNALENEFLLQKKTKELEEISRIDILTDVYTRRYFNEIFDFQWKNCCRSGEKITIIIGDIDYFKNINDTHGHLAGDFFLKKISAKIKEVFQRDTDIIARYGGEEFIILLTAVDLDKAFELAEKARSNIESHSFSFCKSVLKATISFGAANEIPVYSNLKESLIDKADKALYTAKKTGRNRVVLYKENL